MIQICLKEYQLDAEYKKAGNWVLEDGFDGKANETFVSIGKWLGREMFKDDINAQNRFLGSLVRISKADGHFHENEKDNIREVAKIFGLNYNC